MSEFRIPKLALVVFVGPSGAGKSTFASRHFKSSEVLSSDAVRALVRDDELDMSGNADAFAVLHDIARRRLAHGLLTVIDATSVQREARAELVAIARQFHALPVAIVFDLPVEACLAHNSARPGREDSARYVRKQHADMRRSIGGRGAKGLQREGFRLIHVVTSDAEAIDISIVREPLWCDRSAESGPFDIIGDVHGCREELESLLRRLGYVGDSKQAYRHPQGRRVVFVGDLVDRGPDSLGSLRIAIEMVAAGSALCVPGNHDMKLMRCLRGKDVQVSHGLERTLAEFAALSQEDRAVESERAIQFIDDLTAHLVLDGGRLVVAHAGMKESMQGRGSAAVRSFALYGETTGEIDEFGLPVRADWAANYRGQATVVYGHTPVVEPEWINNTMCIDTGCVFGGKLTAMRWPERELVSVPALREHYPPIRPLGLSTAAGLSTQHELDDALDLGELTGKRSITTRLSGRVTIQADESAAAIEVLSRFAANPKWIVYLPPTMSPCETSRDEQLLEHPAEALAYFASNDVSSVVCEKKHMGSRAVVVVCRDEDVARRRFGVENDGAGLIYTRTGRRFFNDRETERALLSRVRGALDARDFWSRFTTDWFCIDAELMPWSEKAVELLRTQYAAVSVAARVGLGALESTLDMAQKAGLPVAEFAARTRARSRAALDFTNAYRGYCWDVRGLDDWKLAPFHLLACDTGVFADRPHRWHMDTLAELAEAEPRSLLATPWIEVNPRDALDVGRATEWWMELTASGGEGMVVKPAEFTSQGKRGLVQPAVKCRGREYLRIIYGPEYTLPVNLERLRDRSLASKRARAVREFALGIEGLERFVKREPLRRVHECVLGVLALESEPVDPRL